MKPRTFSERLSDCVNAGDLIVADLQKWFDRPYPTVRTWAQEGRVPRGTIRQRKRTFDRLRLLEAAIRKKKFPVAIDMNERQRGKYVEGVRCELETAGVP